MFASDKHSILLRSFMNYRCKKFCNIRHMGQCYKKICLYLTYFHTKLECLLECSEMLARDKHSSVLRKFIKYWQKSFITLDPGGFTFGVINIVGNFGSVFCDQSYWQSSVAAKPLQVRIYIHTHIYMYTHTCIYIVCVCLRVCVNLCASVCECVCLCKCVCV
jgi:hypothetical protein